MCCCFLVIQAFARIKGYIDRARNDKSLKILAGGKCDDSVGYFVEPTIIETSDPCNYMMQEVGLGV